MTRCDIIVYIEVKCRESPLKLLEHQKITSRWLTNALGDFQRHAHRLGFRFKQKHQLTSIGYKEICRECRHNELLQVFSSIRGTVEEDQQWLVGPRQTNPFLYLKPTEQVIRLFMWNALQKLFFFPWQLPLWRLTFIFHSV